MASCCCLCRDSVSKDHRRKKRLHGEGCKTAKAVLKEVLCAPLETLVETRDPTSVLCYTCERTLSNIHSLTARVETLKANVRRKLSALQSVILCGEKRPRPISDREFEELPSTKHPHTEKADSAPASPTSTNQPESSVAITAQVTPSRENQSPLQSTTATVEPAVKVPSPHLQVSFRTRLS